ncbi:MAG: hypothetical protein ON057_001336 [Glomeribacter sp. 1016415]|nr:hypothetical protein [Glomeribacter sp. 1016415]
MLKYLASMYATISAQTNGNQATNEQQLEVADISTASQNPSISNPTPSKHNNYPVRQRLFPTQVDYQQVLPPQIPHNSHVSLSGKDASLIQGPTALPEANKPEQIIFNLYNNFFKLKQEESFLIDRRVQILCNPSESAEYDEEDLKVIDEKLERIRSDLSSQIEKLPFEIEEIYLKKLNELNINAYDNAGEKISLLKEPEQEFHRKNTLKEINPKIKQIKGNPINEIAEIYKNLRLNHLDLKDKYKAFNTYNLIPIREDQLINLEKMINNIHTLMETCEEKKLTLFDIATFVPAPAAPYQSAQVPDITVPSQSTQVNSSAKIRSQPNKAQSDDATTNPYDYRYQAW